MFLELWLACARIERYYDTMFFLSIYIFVLQKHFRIVDNKLLLNFNMDGTNRKERDKRKHWCKRKL